uniref:Uncharacterized protein n=1 Tax=Catagonus wagneri TaxID=51154 RepID=A0A8C4FHP8_9CETA
NLLNGICTCTQTLMDFLHGIRVALISFAIFSQLSPDSGTVEAPAFGFFATMLFALDFDLIFDNVAKFLKQGDWNFDCDSRGGQETVCWEGGCDFSE